MPVNIFNSDSHNQQQQHHQLQQQQQQLQQHQALLQHQHQVKSQRSKFASSPASNARSSCSPGSEAGSVGGQAVDRANSHQQLFFAESDSCSSSMKASLSESLAQMSRNSSANHQRSFNPSKNLLTAKDEFVNEKIYNLNNGSTSSTQPNSSRVFNTDLTDERQRKAASQQRPGLVSHSSISGNHLIQRNSEAIESKSHGGSIDDEEDDDEDEENIDDEDNEDEEDTDLEGGNSFDNGNRKKKTRTVFSRNQVFQLESTFDMKRYLSSSERSSLANSLQLTETQIKIWFQNRRNKWKRQLAAEIETNNSLANVIQSHHSNNHQLPQSNNNNTRTTPSYSILNHANHINHAPNSQIHMSQQHAPNASSSQRSVARGAAGIYHQTAENSSNSNKSSFLGSPEIDATNPGLMNSSSLSSSSHSSLSSPHNQQQGHTQSANSAVAAASAVLNNMAAAQQFAHHSSPNLINPSQANGNTLLSPSMLAAAAYYAAAAAAPNSFPSTQFGGPNGAKQPLPGIL